MDGCVSCVASLFQVFMQTVESGAKRAEEKEAEERKSRREEGFLPLSSCPQHLFFFFLLGFLCTVPTICTPGIRGFSGASRLGCGRKKERHQSYQCLKVTRDQAFIFFLLGGGGVKGRKIFINCYAIGYV